jgi:hypothetical protein
VLHERSNDILADIDRDGFALLGSMSRDEYFGLMHALGTPGFETSVELREEIKTYVCQPGEVPMHTDHPEADLIAWRCDQQDDLDGASLIMDGQRVAQNCDARTRSLLEKTYLAPRRSKGHPPLLTPVLRAIKGLTRVCFAPWLAPVSDDPAQHQAYDAFADAIRRAAPTEVRLAEGEVLIVDNARVLHGRRSLDASSRRKLTRLWIRRD